MGSKLAETIIFDIEDEFTDHDGFNKWWWDELDDKKRQLISGKLIGIFDENIEREAENAT